MAIKRFICLLMLLWMGPMVFAQIDSAREGIRIKPSDSTQIQADTSLTIKPTPIKGLSDKKTIQPRINYTPLEERFKRRSGINMVAKSKLLQPTWDVDQKFTEDYQNVSQFSKDYNLGDIRTSSKTLIIECRDHEYVDGDRIKLMINNAVVHPNITLTGQFFSIDVDLLPGYNTISFVALNEGSSRPNTAQVRVLDEEGKLLAANKWLITTGYKAIFTIYKE